MQIMITTSALKAPRVLQFSPWSLTLGIVALMLPLLLVAMLAYHALLMHGAHAKWPLVSNALQFIQQQDVAQRDRFMRENLDAMATKLGDLQARLLRMEAVSERVAGMAGMKPEDFQTIEAPSSAASAAAGGPLATLRLGSGVGRPSVGDNYDKLQTILNSMEIISDHNTDVLTLIESRLFESRLDALMLPSSSPVPGVIGSGFGFRTDPFSGRTALHTGLDFPSPEGTPIEAAAGGVVVTAQFHPQYGNMVEVDHSNGLVTRYAHASKILVQLGDLVKRGQTIALVGSTGRSTGPHLHFEVLVQGVQQNPLRFLANK